VGSSRAGLDELVELRRAQDPDRKRPLDHFPLVHLLRGEEASAEVVDADDRDDHELFHAGRCPELLEVPGGGDEELGGRLLLVGRVGGCVDHRVHTGQRARQPLAGHDVHTVRAGDPYDLVAALLEHVDELAAEPAGRPRNCDPRAVHRALLSSGSSQRPRTRRARGDTH
jgi:hypothetical protein